MWLYYYQNEDYVIRYLTELFLTLCSNSYCSKCVTNRGVCRQPGAGEQPEGDPGHAQTQSTPQRTGAVRSHLVSS